MRVVKVEAPVSLHEVEALVRLVAEGRKEVQGGLSVAPRHGVVEVAVLTLEGRVTRAGRVQVDAGTTKQLETQPLRLRRVRQAPGLIYRVFQGRRQRLSTSMTIVLRSVICSRAKRPPPLPIPLFLPARPPNGRGPPPALGASL